MSQDVTRCHVTSSDCHKMSSRENYPISSDISSKMTTARSFLIQSIGSGIAWKKWVKSGRSEKIKDRYISRRLIFGPDGPVSSNLILSTQYIGPRFSDLPCKPIPYNSDQWSPTSLWPPIFTSTDFLLVGFGVLRLWLSQEWFLRVPKFPSEVLEYFGSGVLQSGSSGFWKSFFPSGTIFGSVVDELFRLVFVPFISILKEFDRAYRAFWIWSAVSHWTLVWSNQ